MTWEILLTPAGDQVSYVGLALILFNLFGYADLCGLCFHQVLTVPQFQRCISKPQGAGGTLGEFKALKMATAATANAVNG